MSKPATETLSVIVEREIPFRPDKIWRALTQPHLIEEWLMKNGLARCHERDAAAPVLPMSVPRGRSAP